MKMERAIDSNDQDQRDTLLCSSNVRLWKFFAPKTNCNLKQKTDDRF